MTDENTTAVATTAFEAYREMNDLHPADSLSYEEACKHDNGDTLADFLVMELTEGTEEAENAAAQYERGIELIERAIRDLQHVQTELEIRHGQLQTDKNNA
jgi:exonuclease VII small subunit